MLSQSISFQNFKKLIETSMTLKKCPTLSVSFPLGKTLIHCDIIYKDIADIFIF